jgi:hypothetical protein
MPAKQVTSPRFEFIPLPHDDLRPFVEGLAAASRGDRWGFIDVAGDPVGECSHQAANDFAEGLAWVDDDEDYAYVDRTGRRAFAVPFSARTVRDYKLDFSEGRALVPVTEAPNGWGYVHIDCRGRKVARRVGWVDDSSEQGTPIYETGFIDEAATLVVPLSFGEVHAFREGRARVDASLANVYPRRQRKWGFVGPLGETVVPCVFEDAEDFSEGKAAVKKDGRWGYIDRDGRTVVPFEQRNLFFIADGVATCSRVDDVARARGAYQEVQGILRIERPANTGG